MRFGRQGEWAVLSNLSWEGTVGGLCNGSRGCLGGGLGLYFLFCFLFIFCGADKPGLTTYKGRAFLYLFSTFCCHWMLCFTRNQPSAPCLKACNSKRSYILNNPILIFLFLWKQKMFPTMFKIISATVLRDICQQCSGNHRWCCGWKLGQRYMSQAPS